MLHRLIFENPTPVFFFALILSMSVLVWRSRFTAAQLQFVAGVSGGISAASYLLINALNISRAGMLWHDEANILSISGAFLHGEPMYHSLAALVFYSLFYGPASFLVYSPFLAAFHHPVLPIRFALFAANITEVFLIYLAVRVWLSRALALALLPIAIGFLLAYPGVLLGTRGDPWLSVFISLAVVVVLRMRVGGWAAIAIATGFLLGQAIDVKVTVGPAVCLVFVILYRRFGLRAAVVSAMACAVSSLGVFALPHISLSNYVSWLMVSSHQRFLRSTCLENVVAALFLVAPIVLVSLFDVSVWRMRRADWLVVLWGGFALLVCILTGSKDGAGGWHLLPMMPFLLIGMAYVASRSLMEANMRRAPALAMIASIAVAGMMVTLYFTVRDFRVVRPLGEAMLREKETMAESELGRVILFSGTGKNLSMGYGSDVADYRSDLRYELPMSGQDYFFDENEVIEGIKEGYPMPQKVLQRMLGCEDIWIVPHGEIPFSSGRSGILPVSTTEYIFPDALRLGFSKTHVRVEQGTVYDLWKCRPDEHEAGGFQ